MEEVKKEIIEGKDKVTMTVKKESPADNKSTGTKVKQTKESITLQKL